MRLTLTAAELAQAWEDAVGKYPGFPEYSDDAIASWSTEALETLNRDGYPGYLETIWWGIIRDLALTGAISQCEFCGSTKRLHVHHLSYEHLCRETPTDLIVLCWSCHADVHDFPKRAEEIQRFAAARDETGRPRLEADE